MTSLTSVSGVCEALLDVNSGELAVEAFVVPRLATDWAAELTSGDEASAMDGWMDGLMD